MFEIIGIGECLHFYDPLALNSLHHSWFVLVQSGNILIPILTTKIFERNILSPF